MIAASQTVHLRFVEPWEFVDEVGAGSFAARVVRIAPSGTQALLELDSAIRGETLSLRYLIVSPRHDHDSFVASDTPPTIHVTGIGVSDDVAKRGNPFDVQWRGGIAFVGDLIIGRIE